MIQEHCNVIIIWEVSIPRKINISPLHVALFAFIQLIEISTEIKIKHHKNGSECGLLCSRRLTIFHRTMLDAIVLHGKNGIQQQHQCEQQQVIRIKCVCVSLVVFALPVWNVAAINRNTNTYNHIHKHGKNHKIVWTANAACVAGPSQVEYAAETQTPIHTET